MSETLGVAIDNEAADMVEVEAVAIESAAPEFGEVEFAENTSGIAEKDSGEESRAEVTSAIGQMACVTCVGCPFFDQCVKPQAMAMKQESEEQESSTDTETGEEAAIIKPVELIPQQSYLEELLAPDEPLDLSGRGQVVRAGYQQPTADILVDDHQEVAMESPEPAAQENDFVEGAAEKTAVVSAPPREEPKAERVEVEPPRKEPESRIEVAAPEAPAVKFDEPEIEENKIISSNDGLAEEVAVVSAPSQSEPPVEVVELSIETVEPVRDGSPIEIDAPLSEELKTDRVESLRDESSIEIVELVHDGSPIEIAPPVRSESPEFEIEKTDDIPTVVEKVTIDAPEKLPTEKPQVEIVPTEELDFTELMTMDIEDIAEPEPEIAEEFQPIDYYQNQEAEESDIKISEAAGAVISSPKPSELVETTGETDDATKSETVIDTMIDDVATSANNETLPLVADEAVKITEPEIKTEEALTDLDDSIIDIQPETEAANKGYGTTWLAELVGVVAVFAAIGRRTQRAELV